MQSGTRPTAGVGEGPLTTGCMFGEAYKTKATEATSTRMRETMPWAVPLRCVCQNPSGWAVDLLANLSEVGIISGAEYAVPSPMRVMAGVRPPGAIDAEEWHTFLRSVVRSVGFPPERARAISLHSGKKTVLTWAGCSGLFSDRELEVLGHHRSSGVGRTVRAYNVSELSAPVAKLRTILDAIASGEFMPDNAPGMQWCSGTDSGSETDSQDEKLAPEEA